MSEKRGNIVDRLRGIYTVPVNDGAGLLNGKDTFTNTFPVPPINKEAADEIEKLRGLLREACDMARAPDDDPERWYGNEIADEWFDRAALGGKGGRDGT